MNVEIVVKIVNFSRKWTSENSSHSVPTQFVERLNCDRIGSLFRHMKLRTANFLTFGVIVAHGAESRTRFNLSTLCLRS